MMMNVKEQFFEVRIILQVWVVRPDQWAPSIYVNIIIRSKIDTMNHLKHIYLILYSYNLSICFQNSPTISSHFEKYVHVLTCTLTHTLGGPLRFSRMLERIVRAYMRIILETVLLL